MNSSILPDLIRAGCARTAVTDAYAPAMTTATVLRPVWTPVLAGVVTAVVGFTSSFAVVVAGLQAVGASQVQAASGLMAVSVTMGVGCVALALWSRLPITTAWSTPGAALLASSAAPDGGFAEAVGAFAVTGALLALTGFVPALGRLVRLVPTVIANAMLAGVLLTLCLTPFRDLTVSPVAIGTVLLAWAVLARFAPRWAVPGALVGALVVLAATGVFRTVDWATAVPTLQWVTPSFSWPVVVAVAVPLYLVTMTSQNIPGVSVLASFGYQVPWRAALGFTGVATVIGAPFGGHAINLAAISAALAAGPEAGEDRNRRWIAAVAAGVGYVLLGLAGGAVVAIAGAAPAGVFAAIAAVGLMSSLVGSIQQAVADPGTRIPAVVTIVVATSGLTVAGIGSAFWALVAGCALVALTRAIRSR